MDPFDATPADEPDRTSAEGSGDGTDQRDPVEAAFLAAFGDEIETLREREQGMLDADRMSALDRAVLHDDVVARIETPEVSGADGFARLRLRGWRPVAGACAAALLMVCSVALILRGGDPMTGRSTAPADERLADGAIEVPADRAAPATLDDAVLDRNGDGIVNVVDALLAARTLEAARRIGDDAALARGPILERTIDRALEESVRVDAASADANGGAS